MSERAEKLREAIGKPASMDSMWATEDEVVQAVCSAIVDELGVTWEMVEVVRAVQRDSGALPFDDDAREVGRAADALATLLKAVGASDE